MCVCLRTHIYTQIHLQIHYYTPTFTYNHIVLCVCECIHLCACLSLFLHVSPYLWSGESRSQLEVSESTSTITNDDTSPAATGGDGFDDDISPAGDREQPGQYHLLKEHDNTSPSSPSQDELDLKHCGAIPKKYSLKQSADPQLQSQNLSSSPSGKKSLLTSLFFKQTVDI